MKKGITVHTVVKNEEKWIWYALMSVLNFVDEILVFDTGSDDKTCKIIKTIKSGKIIFEEKGEVDSDGLVELRREQLARTKTDWLLLLDGDEIWPKATFEEFLKVARNSKEDTWGIVVRAWNLIDDIFHYHEESLNYHWPFAPRNFLGWANLRGLKKTIPGLHLVGSYPLEAYCDETGIPIQNYGNFHLEFLDGRYFHTTYLLRSSSRYKDKTVLNRESKNKFELGKKFPQDFVYPEVFFIKSPEIVDDPWQKRNLARFFGSLILTPIKKIKRILFGKYLLTS